MQTKRDAIKELYRRLDRLPPARSREAAHRLLYQTLDKIETERRGLTVDKDYKESGNARLTVWPLEPLYWSGLNNDIAWMMKGNRVKTELHRDGTIKVTKRNVDGEWTLEYHKSGAVFRCANGHWLTDQFNPETMHNVDPDYLWLAIRAARSYGDLFKCARCNELAELWMKQLEK
ncbi:hypothetical protein [Marinobacter nauticus]|uniref:Uncharacterized protein n=1 Tax=Marinobacter nauticus (strain ATCC 700491 / DSM 11845 / VT8) TaxID=351348 RepID=A1U7Q2_MARN8|nr:hypothetical protein [Marinobacter nauticus]ABM21021.1 hypothetical protein Maqu_4169 [Marinobacter nauticus VT8]